MSQAINLHHYNFSFCIPRIQLPKQNIIPLVIYSIRKSLSAIGKTEIDFFSLDIEGAELSVLKTIPWNKVNIKLVMVEVNHTDRVEEIIELMKYAGYSVYRRLEIDIVFEKF